MYTRRPSQLSRYRSSSRSGDPLHAPVDARGPFGPGYCSRWPVSLLIKLPRLLPTTAAKDFAANFPLPNRLVPEVLAAAAYEGRTLTPAGSLNACRNSKSDEAGTSPPRLFSDAPVGYGNRGFSATPDAAAAGLVSIVFDFPNGTALQSNSKEPTFFTRRVSRAEENMTFLSYSAFQNPRSASTLQQQANETSC